MVETSRTRLESLLLPPKNLRDASGPAARFSLGPPTGSRTATIDVEIADYRVKADTALLFGHLAAQRVGDLLCAGRYGWTDTGMQRSAIASSATSAQGGEHRAHENQSGEFPWRYALSFFALGYCAHQCLAVGEERHGQIMRGQQRLHRAARNRS